MSQLNKWTKEQTDIIKSSGSIKINAVAGSGKTTTVIEYARTRPQGMKILYLAFNKSVKIDAIKKFAAKGLEYVRVETAHALAFSHIVSRSHYKVKPGAYKINEIVDLLQLQGNGEKHLEYILANHISKFLSYFCNSDKQKVQELNYLDTISDEKVKTFVRSNYEYILKQTRIFLGKMDKAEIEITHDFYLKKFQLSQPVLHYDYILFDEGQDASAAMLDVFMRQNAIKVIVGDTHQQIYSWRFAVNSLEKTDFKTYHLSASFRFDESIAELAMQVLKLKEHIETYSPLSISGKGTTTTVKTKAILARTNLGLLLRAIEYVTEHKRIKHIYFEGNIHSYTYADDGSSLYDVLNLYNGKHYLIKDRLIKSMEGIDDLEDYIEKTEDMQLSMMLEIVKEYGNEIPKILENIKARHVTNEDKEKAAIIFSTVHRCKGMEYDSVELVNDFINEERLIKIKEEQKAKGINLNKLNEEINLLYVAITRTKNILEIPEALLPKDWKEKDSTHIHVLKTLSKEDKQKNKLSTSAYEKARSYSIEETGSKNKATNKPWTPELDEQLTELFCNGMEGQAIARHFGRTNGAIAARIKKLGLDDQYL